MKLTKYSVQEFKSVWDSGPIKIDDRITCLVGKNEAGKTALLDALYRTNPILPDKANFDLTFDYPKREVEDYQFSLEKGEREEAVVVECEYQLEQDDIDAVASVFGEKVLKGNTFTRSTYYGKDNSKFSLEVNEQQALKHLTENASLPEAELEKVKLASDWAQLADALKNAEQTEAVTALVEIVNAVKKDGLAHYIHNTIIWPKAPDMMYFDEYYQMKGRANLDALLEREAAGTLKDSDYPLLGLISLARLDRKQLVDTKSTAELKNKLEGASNYLTRRIMKYWSQNKHIKLEFDVREGKPKDPEGMREGVNVWGEVHDTVHWVHTPLGSRSRGFVWFFSFLAWFEDVKRKGQNVILLLDEPGLSLHGRAQADLLEYFEVELGDYQLIYSTHSPFMIDPNHFERVRIVQDLGIDAQEELPKEKDGSKVFVDVLDATDDSLFPLQGALGYEIHQSLFVGPNSLVVEGASDMLFIRAMSAELEREGRAGLSEKWVITPVGGSGKVPAYVALLAPQKGMNIVTLLDFQNDDEQLIENLYKKKILTKKQVLTYADFIEQKEADVEDLFDRDFYLSLVNGEYKKQLSKSIKKSDLNLKIPRTVVAIENYLESNPMKFGEFSHYRPARYFAENVSELWTNVSDATKNRFETIFEKLNGLLK